MSRRAEVANAQFADLTQHEIFGLKTRYNLADAHTHQGQSPSQAKIVDGLPGLWYEAENMLQAELERGFVDAFFELHEQFTALRLNRTLLSYAASISTMVAAMFMRQENMTVTLVEPCFDNLHDLLVNAGVVVKSLPEEALHEARQIYDALADSVRTDALFLVDPNNPTGFTLLAEERAAFREVIRFCRDHRKLLIFDFCFASFTLHSSSGLSRFDVYEELERSGVSYIVIEDTGKTWPVQDAKCALLTVSADIFSAVNDIHTSVLLNVSPFVLNMLTRYLRDSMADRMSSVRDVLAQNRSAVQEAVRGTVLDLQEPLADVSVAWARITDARLTATSLQRQLLREREIYLLPGTFFFWDRPHHGERFVRIALARDPGMFAEAMAHLREYLDDHG